MPKQDSSNPNKDGPSFQAPRQRPRWLMASFCFVLAIFLSVAFIDYSGSQSGAVSVVENGKHVTKPLVIAKDNLVGPFGSYSTYWTYDLFGGGGWLIPFFLFWLTYLAVRSAKRFVGTRIFVMMLAIASLSGLLAMQSTFLSKDSWFPHGAGGMMGRLVYRDGLRNIFGVFGAGMLLGMVYLLGMLFIFTKDIGVEFEKFLAGFHAWRNSRSNRKAELAELEQKEKEARAKQKTETTKVVAAAVGPAGKKLTFAKTLEDPLAKPALAREPAPAATGTKPAFMPPPAPKSEPKPAVPVIKPLKEAAPELKPAAAPKIELNIVKPEEPKKAKVTVPQSADENYKFPPLTLLKERVKPSAENSEEEHRRNAENLLRILSEFGVEVTLGEIHVGPVITRYEVVPAAGVRVEKIAGLDKNIALGMRAQSVRILAPIPGKAAVGVEVPNLHATPVGMREILESEDWAGAKADLPIALGKDVSGKPLISDLAKMPHLLIAGATGSGKSVCINSIVASILYSKSPKDVRLLMVDPKVVELKIFNALPHMLIPVVTEPKKVPAALKWLLGEMEQRYQMFAKVNVRNILGFNARKKNGAAEFPSADAQASLTGVDPLAADDLEIPERLPYIVAIIDELADLMMVAPAEIETSIARLAQLARAAGIHLIIATQRPFVSDEEVQGLVEFLKVNGPPVYANEVQAQIDRAAKEDDDGDDDGDDSDLGDDEELYQQALEVLKSTRRASTSMIQRRLRIGYNRAARIMDLMEEKGVVGPENGSSPREILADLDKL
jgi:S-DNA-T family DNA segregation ATPase FtsK/SpoIIIE